MHMINILFENIKKEAVISLFNAFLYINSLHQLKSAVPHLRLVFPVFLWLHSYCHSPDSCVTRVFFLLPQVHWTDPSHSSDRRSTGLFSYLMLLYTAFRVNSKSYLLPHLC